MNDQVNILLATYQGGLYLREQLQSLMQQSYPHFHIFIRDDGSTDQTLMIVDQFQQAFPQRISVISSSQRLGVKANFSALMQHAKAPYIMLCDQDDVWLPHKIEVSLREIKKMESRYGTQTPLLLHTDLKVVNSDLSLIHSSFWRYSKLNPYATSLNSLLSRNIVTGCTLMMNQALLQLSLPIPEECLMHDWWIALVAATFGSIGVIKEPTMLYRQHGKNTVGAKKISWWQALKIRLPTKKAIHPDNLQQAQQLLKRYSSLLHPSQKEIIHSFCASKVLVLNDE
jgi:glycosyltransferase involved in cell wall biosynthesis